jgi:hypothetical protein
VHKRRRARVAVHRDRAGRRARGLPAVAHVHAAHVAPGLRDAGAPTRVHLYTDIYAYTCIHIDAGAPTRVHLYMDIYAYTYIHIDAGAPTRVHLYMDIYAYTYIHIDAGAPEHLGRVMQDIHLYTSIHIYMRLDAHIYTSIHIYARLPYAHKSTHSYIFVHAHIVPSHANA